MIPSGIFFKQLLHFDNSLLKWRLNYLDILFVLFLRLWAIVNSTLSWRWASQSKNNWIKKSQSVVLNTDILIPTLGWISRQSWRKVSPYLKEHSLIFEKVLSISVGWASSFYPPVLAQHVLFNFSPLDVAYAVSFTRNGFLHSSTHLNLPLLKIQLKLLHVHKNFPDHCKP